MSVVAGLLLAAGAGRRMGRPKALLRDPDGTPWVTRSGAVLSAGGCTPVLVVVGAAAHLAEPLVPAPARAVHAPDWAEGMGASLRTGLRALAADVATDVVAPGTGPDVVAALIGLVDTPGVTPAVVALLVEAALAAGPGVLARAGYHGVPGHPVVLGRDHWEPVAATASGDTGARGYLASRRVGLVECGDAGDGRDVDTPGLL